jgi:hypothetical protein
LHQGLFSIEAEDPRHLVVNPYQVVKMLAHVQLPTTGPRSGFHAIWLPGGYPRHTHMYACRTLRTLDRLHRNFQRHVVENPYTPVARFLPLEFRHLLSYRPSVHRQDASLVMLLIG